MNRRLATYCLTLMIGLPLAASIPGGSVIVGILGISFLIFVHEWGHFYACKLTGTRTETFSIGFGPRLFGWEKTRDGTRRFTIGRRQTDPADHAMDFRVAAIPLGGYVKMAGEMPGEGGDASGEPKDDEFQGKSAWARIFIISAGVIMNFITAFVFYTACIQFNKPYRPPLVGEVEAGSAAWLSGVKPGDRIVSIDGTTTPTFTDLRIAVAVGSGDRDTDLVIERDGVEQKLAFQSKYDEEAGILQFGVKRSAKTTLGTGDNTFTIGATDRATIAGVPVVGGAQAFDVIGFALDGGVSLPLPIVGADGATFELAPREAEPAGEKPGAKVGLGPWMEAMIVHARGPAATVLQKEDVLLTATAGGKVRPLDNAHALQSLAFHAPITQFTVRRGGETKTLPLELQDAASAADFLRDIVVRAKTDGARVTPLEAGLLVPQGTDLWRYASVPAADIPRGARVLQIGDSKISNFTDLLAALKGSTAGSPLAFTIREGDGPERTVTVTPAALEFVGALDLVVVEHMEPFQPDGFGQSIAWGWDRLARETGYIFKTIGALVTGQLSFTKNIAGPVRIIGATKQFAEDSSLQLLWFLAYVSVMLAVLNILPIPILDGGHLMFILIEKVRGKPLKDDTIYNMMKIGMVLLLTLMVFAFWNDIKWLLDIK